MNGVRRFDVTEHLSEAELDIAINEAQKTDELSDQESFCILADSDLPSVAAET